MVGSPWLNRAGLAVLLALLAGCFVRWFERKNLYAPSRLLTRTPADAGLPFEDVTFMAEDGVRLHGWWIPAEVGAATLLFCHGNAGNLSDRVDLLAGLRELGMHLFAFDYRGYGRSRGRPGEAGTYRDARAAFEVVRARYDDSNHPPVVVYGRSLGGAVAAQLALDKPVRGVILESTFTSSMDMARELFPLFPAWAVHNRYDTRAKVARIRLPTLISHSPTDEVVPYALGTNLYASAAGPKQFVRLSGGHNESGWLEDASYRRAFREFVEECLRRPADGGGRG